MEYSDDLQSPVSNFHEATVIREADVSDGVETTPTFTDDLRFTGGLPPLGRRLYRIGLVPEP